MSVYSVSELWIYPIKSCKGIQLVENKIVVTGFQYDRRFMVVDEENNFLTQRQHHKMALITCKIVGEDLQISATDYPTIRLPLNPLRGTNLQARVWSDTCESIEIGERYNEWFSSFLGLKCKLVYMPETSNRIVDPNYNTTNAITSFSDGFPFLLISQASLDDLNSKLEDKISMTRFRPNIVVVGTEPFEEDNWQEIKIDEIVFQVVKPCSRCVITTIDQTTGISGKEPLKTLSKYRSVGNKIMFGQNLIHLQKKGSIKVGAQLQILSIKPNTL